MKTIREDVDEILDTLKKIKIENIKITEELDKQKTKVIILSFCLLLSFLLIFMLFLV